MNVGELYKVRPGVLTHHNFWSNCGPMLYLGEDVIDRKDGVRIINHLVLVKGEKRLLDRTFLKFLEPLTSS
jgi:hypothetical protein